MGKQTFIERFSRKRFVERIIEARNYASQWFGATYRKNSADFKRIVQNSLGNVDERYYRYESSKRLFY